MGWLWASPSPPKPSTPLEHTPSATKPAPSEPSNIDPEIQKFLDLFASDTKKPDPVSSPPPREATPSSQSSQSTSGISSWFALKKAPEDPQKVPAPPLHPLAENLLPTDMSCRQAFDIAWGCNSIGGQWNAVYRYGEMRECSEQWDDFWFCMRTKSYTGDLKADAVRAHYRHKEHNKYGGDKPSSEDIWESRTGKLAPDTAFADSVDLPGVDDDEWRRQDNERRRKIREGLNNAPA